MKPTFHPSSRTQIKFSYLLVATAAIYLFAVGATTPYFWADATDYVDSVTDFQKGKYYEFWEFGHLLWRPLGWLVWTTACDLSDPYYWRYQIFKIFQWFNLTAGLVSALLMAYILRQLNIRDRINILTVSAFICSHAFLNYTQTGTSYVTGLFFLILAIALVISPKPRRPRLISALAGLSLALSAGFWIAYIWAIPAAVLTVPILYGFSRDNITRATLTLGTFGLGVFFIFAPALYILGINNFEELINWIRSASHGNQIRGIIRVIYGLPQTHLYMPEGGTVFKRFLLGDPYNPVSPADLINSTLLKLIVFYLTAALLSRSLFGSYQGKRIFILLLTAAVPMLTFATMFDGAAIERYLPIIPFAFISFAFACKLTTNKLPSLILPIAGILLIILNLLNLQSLSGIPVTKATLERADLISNEVAESDVVFLVNWQDELVNFSRSYPFHHLNRGGNQRYLFAITPGTSQATIWREEFAARTFLAWEQGSNVWLSTRAFIAEPDPSWRWAEGDDKNLEWKNLHRFFKNLSFGEHIGGFDGFATIEDNEHNRRFLALFALRYQGFGR